MAVGLPLKTTYANGDVYSASDVNDTNGTINAYVTTGPAAGVNKIINGDFGVWQRGTSFTLTTGSPVYTTDRFVSASAFSAGSCVISRQTFTAGTAPVSGYEGTYFIRYTLGSTTTSWECFQKIEDVRAFAGQTMTVSFWAKSSSAQGLKLLIQQNFGSGGSGSVNQSATLSNLSTSWTRYTATFTIASISGKTIGTNSHLLIDIFNDTSITGSSTIDIWGVQVEQGSTATAFQTATGTIQGELAACQRYYWRSTAGAVYQSFAAGQAASTTVGLMQCANPVPMRVAPTSIDFSTVALSLSAFTVQAVTALTIDQAGSVSSLLRATVASGLITGNATVLIANNSTSAYVGLSAEL
jgi:hypothetical protein